ncbi:MAG: LamG domain-containing protein, partial [Candidatus Pacebacteria bacterium]|nr:LamG domain-containing protein [Candidatus Paceibacterota bacterium]
DGGDSIASFEIGTNLKLTPSAVQEYKRDSSLIGYWTFDEGSGATAGDSSGNGYSGTWGGTGTHWSTGSKVGSYAAIFAPASSDYINMTNAALRDATSAISISAWIKPVKNPSSNTTICSLGYNWTNNNGIGMWVNPDSGGRPYFMVGNGSTKVNFMGNSSTISDNVWYHFVGTYDGTLARIYLNGIYQTSDDIAGPISYNTGNVLYIGAELGSGGKYEGIIDDFRIYNRTLSAAEILALYDASK